MSTRACHRYYRVCTVFLTVVVVGWTIGALFLFQSYRGVGSMVTNQTDFGFLGWEQLVLRHAQGGRGQRQQEQQSCEQIHGVVSRSFCRSPPLGPGTGA